MSDNIKISTSGKWRLYWGPGPLPQGAKALGTVQVGLSEGALIELPTGILRMGNAGAMRSLSQRETIMAMGRCQGAATAGATTSAAKAKAARVNGRKGGRPPARK